MPQGHTQGRSPGPTSRQPAAVHPLGEPQEPEGLLEPTPQPGLSRFRPLPPQARPVQMASLPNAIKQSNPETPASPPTVPPGTASGEDQDTHPGLSAQTQPALRVRKRSRREKG